VIRSAVTGVGSYLPPNIVSNQDLASFVDTTDAWITERTGIRQRHQASADQAVSDLAVEAAKKALQAAGKTPADVDLIIVATTTPDLTFPATAAIVQRKLGCPVGIAFDLQAVCSGFVFALPVADAFVSRGQSKCALVIGAETMTRLMDWEDRGILGTALRTDGTKQDLLYVDGGPSTNGLVGKLRMQGNLVFKHAVINISEAVVAAAAASGIALGDVDWLIPHQANLRILKAVASRLGIDESKVITTVDRHANTSAASIPLALDAAMQDGRIKPGQLIMVEAMGGGLTWGAAVIRL